jgi:hypothetical protein
VVNLSTFTGFTPQIYEVDSIYQIEYIYGSNLNDSLVGDGFDNVINGLNGNDFIDCMGGVKFSFLI